MRVKHVAGITLIVIGALLAFNGAMNASQSLVNAGIGGVFLGIVVLTFSTSDYMKYDAFRAVVHPYVESARNLVTSLGLKGRAVYIPPYSNMPEGGVFIPLHEDFSIDLARTDSRTVFLTDTGREKEMGLILTPAGKELVSMYEEFSGMDFANAGLQVVESISAVLKSLGLARSVDAEESDGRIRIYIDGVKMREVCSEECEQIACPICSSAMLSLAKAFQELIMVEKFSFDDRFVEISARKIGGIERWM